MFENWNEGEQLTAARNGKTEAFGKIVEHYQGLVCAITYSITGDLGASEELAQEVFVNAWQNLHQLRELSSFKNWLATIARHAAIQYVRNRRHDILHGATSINENEKSETASYEPARLVISKEEQTMMWNAIEKLPQDYREILILYYRERHSTKEVSELLGIEENSARVRVHRGRQMLQEQVASLIEANLERSRPDKNFTKAVMVAIGGISAAGISSASAATIAAKSTATAGSAAVGTTAVSTGTVGGGIGAAGMTMLTVAAVIVAGGAALIGYHYYSGTDRNQSIPAAIVQKQPLNNSNNKVEQVIATQPVPVVSTNSVVTASDANQMITVKVSVIDVNASPVPGAEITFFRGTVARPRYKLDAEQYVNTDSNGNAIFLSRKMAPVKSVVGRSVGFMLVEKAGKACGWSRWNPTEDQDIKITLAEPSILSGIIVDCNDKPISDVTVSLRFVSSPAGGDCGYLIAEKPFNAFAFQTNADGKFEMCLPENTQCSVFAEKAGMATTYLYDESGNPKQVTVPSGDIKIVMNPTAAIEGKVVEQFTGAGLKGVAVKLSGPRLNHILKDEMPVTDENGRFRFDLLEEGIYTVNMALENEKVDGWVSEPVVVNVEAGKTTKDIIVKADNGGRVEIRVVDDSGNPLERATCEIVSDATGTSDRATSTDANGMTRWASKPGEYTIKHVSSFHFGGECNVQFNLESGKLTRAKVVISMAGVKGIVHDPNGAAAKDVSVTLMPVNEEVRTDSNGLFTIAYDNRMGMGAQFGPIVVARDTKHNLAAAVMVQDGNHVDMRLATAITVTGRAVDTNGMALSCSASAIIASPGWSYCSIANLTGSKKGGFSLSALPAGIKYSVRISASGYGAAEREIQDNVVTNVDLGDIVLMPAQETLTGMLVDENDAPVSGAYVYISGEGQPENQNTIQSDAQGSFHVRACKGTVNITAVKGNLSGFIQVESGTSDLKLILKDNAPKHYQSLAGKPIPTLSDFVDGIGSESLLDKRLAITFTDLNEVPANIELGDSEKTMVAQIKAAGVEIIVVTLGQADANALNAWSQKAQLPLKFAKPVVETEKIRSAFGVNRLPWIILTDSNHVVQYEGTDGKEVLNLINDWNKF